MPLLATRPFVHRFRSVLIAAGLLGSFCAAFAAEVPYYTVLSGANESPPNGSLGVGTGYAYVDATAHTMRVIVDFANLTTGNTACHIHAPTTVALTGTIGVATTTPTFTGFPTGATTGTYDHTFDMTLSSSYNGSFITNFGGGTVAGAEAALFAAIAAGKAYVNVHTSTVPGGEIRGFLVPFDATPTAPSTWGRLKTLYR